MEDFDIFEVTRKYMTSTNLLIIYFILYRYSLGVNQIFMGFIVHVN